MNKVLAWLFVLRIIKNVVQCQIECIVDLLYLGDKQSVMGP